MAEDVSSVRDRSTSDIRTSDMVSNSSTIHLGKGATSSGHTVILQDGFELMHWNGAFAQQRDIPLVDDSDRICFSFNCNLKGQAACLFNDGIRHEYEVREGAGSIQYGPGRRGVYRQQGMLSNLTILLRPDLFAGWVEDADDELRLLPIQGGFLEGHRGGEMQATAQALIEAIATGAGAADGRPRHPLWLQAQSMTLISLFLEARGLSRTARMAATDRNRLMRAREMLLADLTCAPSLAELASEAGVSVPTLTRGFQRLFGKSPYVIFQQERMHVARYRLASGDGTATTIAADLGYTNASHFSAAFRRQFGMSPKQVRRD